MCADHLWRPARERLILTRSLNFEASRHCGRERAGEWLMRKGPLLFGVVLPLLFIAPTAAAQSAEASWMQPPTSLVSPTQMEPERGWRPVQISPVIGLVLPTGELADIVGLGGMVGVDLSLPLRNPSIHVGASVDYTNFTAKSFGGGGEWDGSVIVAKVGPRLLVHSGETLIIPQVALSVNRFSFSSSYPGSSSHSESTTKIGLSGGVDVGVPFLSRIPVLGRTFLGARVDRSDETRLIILIRPTLRVDPYED
jgi:hypothetical protein